MSHWIEHVAVPTGCELVRLDSTASTNTDALSHSPREAAWAVIAKSQHAGRGRRNKAWVGGADNVYLSIGFKIPVFDSRISLLALHASASVVAHLVEHGYDVQLKWPNDIYSNKGKVGGLLVESVIKGSSATLAIGLGLNWVAPVASEIEGRLPDGLQRGKALSHQSKADLVSGLIQTLLQEVIHPAQGGKLSTSIVWPAVLDRLIGTELSILTEACTETGRYNGVDSQGQLHVCTNDGRDIRFSAEQVLHCRITKETAKVE